ncbi:MAG: hypothetical protein LC790_05395, partial [Actinobacteria bacterium]|nr:hypothetical protein [Actinomycetota bacterium]
PALKRWGKRGGAPSCWREKDYVGGRTASWIDEGMPVESGHHRMLGFYKALPQLLSDWVMSVEVV